MGKLISLSDSSGIFCQSKGGKSFLTLAIESETIAEGLLALKLEEVLRNRGERLGRMNNAGITSTSSGGVKNKRPATDG